MFSFYCCVIGIITRLIIVDIAQRTVLVCNYPLICICPLLNDISFNTKCLLFWSDYPVITCLVRTIFGINYHRDFWKVWNCPRFIRATLRFSKLNPANLSQIALPDMWLLVLISMIIYIFSVICCNFIKSLLGGCLFESYLEGIKNRTGQ